MHYPLQHVLRGLVSGTPDDTSRRTHQCNTHPYHRHPVKGSLRRSMMENSTQDTWRTSCCQWYASQSGISWTYTPFRDILGEIVSYNRYWSIRSWQQPQVSHTCWDCCENNRSRSPILICDTLLDARSSTGRPPYVFRQWLSHLSPPALVTVIAMYALFQSTHQTYQLSMSEPPVAGS